MSNLIKTLTIFIAVLAASANVPTATLAQTEEVFQQQEAETNRFFEQAHGSLDAALKLFDKQESLPGSSDLAFYDFLSRTKESENRKIESYLDAAAGALGISSISDRRNRIGDVRSEIKATRQELTVFQRKIISAPIKSYNPLVVTESGYQQKIETAKQKIQLLEQTIEEEKQRLVSDLQKIGMELDAEKIDMLLESITGDEFVRVSIIFDNAKAFALELEQLTEQTGEDLEAAKKYYGVYLMLLKTVERLQSKFIDNVDNVYYPKLDQFADKAKQNIVEAKKAINAGADALVLENNMASNQLTYDATQYYKQGLAQQKHQMMIANLQCKKNILTATNTYKTVALSKDVANLLATSRRAFDSISNLAVPDLRPFENAKMRAAFDKLTQELRK
jgi:hypothetical protein